jgi:Xaa-Pro aminopeptidase
VQPHQAERLTTILDDHGLEALVATRGANVAYVTDFRGIEHALFETPLLAVFSRRGTGLAVAAVELASVVEERIDVDHLACFDGFPAVYDDRRDVDGQRIRELAEAHAPSPADALAGLLDALGVRRGSVGLDESRLTPAAWQTIAARLGGLTLVPGAAHLRAARRVKSPWEIERLGLALGLVEEALNEVIATLAPGMTEREAATLYQSEVVKRGGAPVSTTIATGKRTWIPRPAASERPLRAREAIRFDVGATLDGYHASVSRTAVAGEPDPRLEAAHTAILAGLEAALDAIGPGVPASRVYAAAVEATHGAGLKSYVASHVGHGIGLEPREGPRLEPAVEAPLEAGEVVRVELAHVEMGWAGVQLAETVLVTTGGARALNRSSRRLIILD